MKKIFNFHLHTLIFVLISLSINLLVFNITKSNVGFPMCSFQQNFSTWVPYSVLVASETNGVVMSSQIWVKSGNVGVGTATPRARFHVIGDILSPATITASRFCLVGGNCITSWSSMGQSHWTLAGLNLYPNSTAYNVGIGTTTPQAKLDVVGNVNVRGNFYMYGTRESNLQIYSGDNNKLSIGHDKDVGDWIQFRPENANGLAFLNAPDSITMVVATTSNVGIGTTTPQAKLHVVGDTLVSGKITSFGSIVASGTYSFPFGFGLRINSLWGPWARQYSFFSSTGTQLASFYARGRNGDNIERVSIGKGINSLGFEEISQAWLSIIPSTGNVGIGTTNPTEKLDVIGKVKANAFCLGGNCITSWPSMVSTSTVGQSYWTLTGSNLYPSSTAYNVGIGTTTPQAKLHVRGNTLLSVDEVKPNSPEWHPHPLRIMGSKQVLNIGVNSGFEISYLQSLISGIGFGDISLNPAGGNVSIGRNKPTAKLDVAGRIQVSDNHDNVFGVKEGNLMFDLIGTYKGWDRNAIYIAGYNQAHKQILTTSSYSVRDADKVIFGGRPYERMTVDLISGNVGIGTTNPTEKLDVIGKVKANAFCLGGNCITSWPSMVSTSTVGQSYWTLTGSNLYPSSTAYNVGIGTTTPQYKLHVIGDISATRLCLGNDCRSSWPSSSGTGGQQGDVVFSESLTPPSGYNYANDYVYSGRHNNYWKFVGDNVNYYGNSSNNDFNVRDVEWGNKIQVITYREEGWKDFLYIFTGEKVLKFDGKNVTFESNFPENRYFFGAARVGDDVYIVGGFGDIGMRNLKREVMKYNLKTRKWFYGRMPGAPADLPTPRAELGVVELDGKIYAIGGRNFSYSPFKVVEEYNPLTNSWTRKEDLPTGMYGFAIAVVKSSIFNDNSSYPIFVPSIHIIGGVPNKHANYQFTPYLGLNGFWERASDLPMGRMKVSGIAINEKIYIMGGDDGGQRDHVQEYDPMTDTWQIKQPIPYPVHGQGLGILNGKIYSIGGWSNRHYVCENKGNCIIYYDPGKIYYIHRKY